MKLEEPIAAKTKIIIDTEHCEFTEAMGRGGVLEIFSGQVKRAIESDLKDNVFPNAIERTKDDTITIENPLVLPETDVQLFVFVYIHKIHVNAWRGGSSRIELIMKSQDGTIIKKYDTTGESGMNLTILKGAMNAVGNAMEKIKKFINKDRNEIVQKLE